MHSDLCYKFRSIATHYGVSWCRKVNDLESTIAMVSIFKHVTFYNSVSLAKSCIHPMLFSRKKTYVNPFDTGDTSCSENKFLEFLESRN